MSVQFRTSTGSYTTVKTTTSRADGWISTTVPAKQTGVWRVVYSGNTLAGAAVAAGDAVQVTGRRGGTPARAVTCSVSR